MSHRLAAITIGMLVLGAADLARGDGAADEPADEPAVEIEGRVFVRDTASRVDLPQASWRNEYGVASARLQASYRPADDIKLNVEVELAGGEADLADVYVRLEPRDELRLEVGRFKRPVSPISLESAWKLPTVERGLLNEPVVAVPYEVRLPFGGRSEGATVRYQPGVAGVSVTGGLFNSRLASRTDDAEAYDPTLNLLADGFVRGEVEPHDDLTLGSSIAATRRVIDSTGAVDHAWSGSVDVTWKPRPGKLWLELFYGQSPFLDATAEQVDGNFRAARLLVAPRLVRSHGRLRRVDAFASASILDLRDDRGRDWAAEVGGGAAVGFRHDWRLQAQYARIVVGDAYPSAGLDRIYLQLGSVF